MNEQEKSLLYSIIDLPNTKNRERKIIFWYDDKKEYEEFIDDESFINELEEKNTKIVKFENNSIWIRYYLEKENTENNIIIYIPLGEKKIQDNSLLDFQMENIGYEFSPDRVSILMQEFELPQECKDLMKKYEKFFKDKTRSEKFRNFGIEINENNFENVIIAVLLNIKTISSKNVYIDDIFKAIFVTYYSDKKRFEEFKKQANEQYVFELFNNTFGSKIESYNDLEQLFKSLLLTYFYNNLKDRKLLDKYTRYILNKKSNNVQVFINELMNDVSTKQYFEELSMKVDDEFGISEIIEKYDVKIYQDSDAFKSIDERILNYIASGVNLGLGDYSIYKDLLLLRKSKYWYNKFYNEYEFLDYSIKYFETMLVVKNLIKQVSIEEFFNLYTNTLYEVDNLYRKIYYYFDNIQDKDDFINLKDSIENHYVNTYMMNLSIKWNDMITGLESYNNTKIPKQYTFYEKYIKPNIDKSGRIIVIASDAFRYECAKELNERLKVFSNKSDLSYMQGSIPSYTKLGMASLLPNKELSRSGNGDDILVDGMNSSSTKDREKILQKEIPESMAIQYDELVNMKKGDWKKLFTGKKLVYIYHNTIDNAGEHDENKIFDACEEAINELEELIKDLHTTFSGVNLYVTADHGFFYKRGKIESYGKTKKDENATTQKTRYSYTEKRNDSEEVVSFDISYIFNKETGYVNIPKGSNIFARQGLGTNYVHGGILPQEIIIPVIDFKSDRFTEDGQKVKIDCGGNRKITSIVTKLPFIQVNNVDEDNLECRYLLHFEDEEGNRISDECTIIANYRETEVKNRTFEKEFVFKNMNYSRDKNYYLIIIDEEKYNSLKEKDRENSIVNKIKFTIDMPYIE